MLFRFFELPRLFRDEVYGHVWSPAPCILLPYSIKRGLKTYKDVTIQGFARFDHEPGESIPRVLSANKALFVEALEAFLRMDIVNILRIEFEHLGPTKRRDRPAVPAIVI
jgi:hypothetical protein